MPGRINGDRGFVLYHGANGHSHAMLMLQEDGAWKVGSLEPGQLE